MINSKIKALAVSIIFGLSTSFTYKATPTPGINLTVKVEHLKNSGGYVQAALYNKDGSIPDETFQKCIKLKKAKIVNNCTVLTFENLPAGRYAVNVFHDENNNGKIDKGFLLPTEGIGFSNFKTINIANRPNFTKASFMLQKNTIVNIPIIYM